MSYTLPEWTKFCEEEVTRLHVVELPILETAFNKAIPGSKKHCTIANSVAMFTGMDADAHQIAVDAKYIKCVLNGVRYFFIHEVVGAEHIKQLDSLTFEGSGAAFEPFVLKLRYHEQRKTYTRAPKPSLSKKPAVKSRKETKGEEGEVPSAAVISQTSPTGRNLRKDSGVKSRWAR
jgi:hypothetical protein